MSFSCRDKSFSEAVNEKTFCLAEGTFFLKKDHAYFFQVQMQMKLCQVKFCDFVVWGKDGAYLMQRIKYDEEFTENALVQVKSFVKLCLLPELLSRCFTSGMKNLTPLQIVSQRKVMISYHHKMSQRNNPPAHLILLKMKRIMDYGATADKTNTMMQ